jgi:hypothetical protein
VQQRVEQMLGLALRLVLLDAQPLEFVDDNSKSLLKKKTGTYDPPISNLISGQVLPDCTCGL